MNLRGFVTAVVLAIFVTGFSTSPAPYIAHGQSLSGREYHVSPTGTATNDGSAQRPLDLVTALSSKSPAKAGDIIWLHAGVYRGAFKSVIAGTAASPIIVRQFPGERATIDSSSSGGYDALSVTGAYTWFWGFEIASSDTKRISAESGSWPQDLRRGYGAVTITPGTKFINMIVHDNANGLGLWTQSVDGEAYGNVIYNNGWQAPDRSHGHGVYTQNASGTRLVAENIIFNQFSHGIHAYGSDAAALDNITLDGNITFMNGAMGTGGMYANGRDILLGGYRVAGNPVLSNNATNGAQVNLGYSAGCSNGRVTNNYIIGGFALVNCNPVMTGNAVYDATWPNYGTRPAQYPQNTFYTTQPTGTVIRVRPNKYEPGRANIVIYNWGQSSVVSVDLAAAKLTSGAAYQIRDAQNYYGTPVVDSVYDGRPVNLVMTGLRTAAPIGNVPIVPPHTAPKFAAFVVVPKSASTGPTPPTAPGPTVTLALSTSSVTPGQSATLSWSTTNASAVSIDSGVGSVAVNGTRTVAPTVTTTYTATATNSAGESATSQVTLQVTTTPPTPPPGGGTGIGVQLTSPANNAVALNQSTVTLSADVADPAGIVKKVEFYRGTTMIGTAWTKPFTLPWTNVSTGTYSVTARAYDQGGVVGTSGAATLKVTAAPTVRLTSPAAGSYGMPATLTLSATATDGDGGVARVEFYRGATLIGQDASSPYSLTWSGAPEGTHVLTAKAIDTLGMAATSAAVSVTVGQPPSVQLISPNAAGTYLNQGTIVLEANATAPGGRITKVEFHRNGILINSVLNAPYRLNWTYVSTGTYTITAKAYSDKGLSSQSAPVTITVKPN